MKKRYLIIIISITLSFLANIQKFNSKPQEPEFPLSIAEYTMKKWQLDVIEKYNLPVSKEIMDYLHSY